MQCVDDATRLLARAPTRSAPARTIGRGRTGCSGRAPSEIVDERGLRQISDLGGVIDEVVADLGVLGEIAVRFQ